MSKHKILMLEYDEDDRYLTQSHFRETFPEIRIDFVDNSDDFFAHLNNSRLTHASLPSLVLMNFNSTPMNAVEIMKRLKADRNFCHIPVVILSSQKQDDIIKECYAAGASSFILKPALFNDTNDKISSFVRYWFQTAELNTHW